MLVVIQVKASARDGTLSRSDKMGLRGAERYTTMGAKQLWTDESDILLLVRAIKTQGVFALA